MKFLPFVLFIMLFFHASCFAIEEVQLQTEENKFDILWENLIDDDKDEDTLFEHIMNIKHREVSDTTHSIHLLDKILTKKFETGPIESAQIFGYYRGYADMDLSNDADTEYGFTSIEAGVSGKLRDGTRKFLQDNFYEVRLRFNQFDNYSFLQGLPGDIYVANASIPNHTVILGHTRTPSGYEGGRSNTTLPFIARAQISRNFGNVRKVGLRVKGNYDLVEYDLGGYSSDTFFREFFPGAEFSGWLTLKPLGKTQGKYGKLKLGGGLTAGSNDVNYTVSGVYASYEYKNFYSNFEYAYADGYNGAKTLTTNKAEGFYTTLGYKLTPKVQLLVRYDQFTPNKNFKDDIRREYSAGLNYFIKGQALKLMLNYVFCQNDIREDSHRLIIGSQLLL